MFNQIRIGLTPLELSVLRPEDQSSVNFSLDSRSLTSPQEQGGFRRRNFLLSRPVWKKANRQYFQCNLAKGKGDHCFYPTLDPDPRSRAPESQKRGSSESLTSASRILCVVLAGYTMRIGRFGSAEERDGCLGCEEPPHGSWGFSRSGKRG